MSFVSWMIDMFASEDVIDSYFILSDLVDINLTDAEICESAAFDSLTDNSQDDDDPRPIGKRVY